MSAFFPQGRFRDTLLGARGEILWARDWQPNLILDGMRSLVAGLLKGDEHATPLAYWAVGGGDDAWDAGNLPSEQSRRRLTRLFKETCRQPIPGGSVRYVGGNFTNELEVSGEFSFTSGLVQLREFGLFAGNNAGPAADTGLLINHRIHPRIDMEPGFTLQRTLRLTF